MLRPLSDFPVIEVAGFHAVVVRDWRSVINQGTVRWLGKPLRAECKDLWILTTTAEDAAMLAKLTQRDFLPEDVTARRERYVTTKRQPTFATVLPHVPVDVACYLSGTAGVDDHAMIQILHPTPPRVNESISWSSAGYLLRSGHGFFRETIACAPGSFASALKTARENLLEKVGPGFDGTLGHLNASPILAAMLDHLTRPAAEAAAHWMRQLGTREMDRLVIPARGIDTDLPVTALVLESTGINLHASFFLNMGDVRVTEMEITGLDMPDTMGVAFDAEARKGCLTLSQIVDLPGAESVPVLSVSRQGSGWHVRIDPVCVPITPPVSDIAFQADDEIARIENEGNEVSGDTAIVLRPLGRERAAFILYCVQDGNSGMDYDITPWMPEGMSAEVLLRERSFILRSSRRTPPTSFLEELP